MVSTVESAAGFQQCTGDSCWLWYDDGSASTGGGPPPGGQTAVKFSLPTGWTSARLFNAWFYASGTFILHVYAAKGVTELTASGTTVTMTSEPSTISLAGMGIGGQDITVTGDFFISLEFTAIGFAGEVASDSGPTQGHSYDSATTPPSFVLLTSRGNYMIRAEVEQPMPPSGAPVGGFIGPVNKLAIITPYVALFGLVATVAVVIVKPWKKPEN